MTKGQRAFAAFAIFMGSMVLTINLSCLLVGNPNGYDAQWWKVAVAGSIALIGAIALVVNKGE